MCTTSVHYQTQISSINSYIKTDEHIGKVLWMQPAHMQVCTRTQTDIDADADTDKHSYTYRERKAADRPRVYTPASPEPGSFKLMFTSACSPSLPVAPADR
jgi:hypothetical protein